ncbi:MAG: HypC/HybG/HupF family hydrogenase formation chaperone [Actinomycetota bacterium]|nr:HypC/HybG/HupF family hydrogenase formation chaperone [Actinomycetota bacterium]
MCLAVPAKVVSIDNKFITAEVDIMGNSKRVGIVLTPEVEVGSWVMVHAGQAISVIEEEAARLSLSAWEELLRGEQ